MQTNDKVFGYKISDGPPDLKESHSVPQPIEIQRDLKEEEFPTLNDKQAREFLGMTQEAFDTLKTNIDRDKTVRFVPVFRGNRDTTTKASILSAQIDHPGPLLLLV